MNTAKFTTLVIVTLVALRLGCGWLFFREGSKKLDSGTFQSQHFLAAAQGPLAGMYQSMVPDIYGAVRMSADETKVAWENARREVAQHFNFDKKQQQATAAAFDRAMAKLNYFFDENEEEIKKFYLETGWVNQAKADPNTNRVNFRKTWSETKQKELDGKLKRWLASIDGIWKSYEADLNSAASREQRAYYGTYKVSLPGSGVMSSSFADRVIPWFTFSVGVLLVLGLFTRFAAICGAAFLASVIFSQPPWVIGAEDTNYQIVLLLGLLVIAATGAGRWGGLDFFLGLVCKGCCIRRTSRTSTPPVTPASPALGKA